MGIERTVKIKVDNKDAVSGLDEIKKSFEKLTKTAEDLEKEISETTDPKKLEFLKKQLSEVNKELGKTEEGFKKSKKSANGFGGAIKGIGTAIKATGIGLLVAGVAKLSMAFAENSKVSKVLKETFETINLVFGSFVNAIVDAVTEVGKAEGQFDSLKKVVSSVITVSLTPLKILLGGLKMSFFSIQQTVQKVQLAWEKSWLGGKGKDKERIKELEKSIQETDESIKKTGESIEKAGKDGFDAFKTYAGNIGKAIGEVSNVTEKAVKNVSKINLEEIENQAKALVKLREKTKIAIAQNELILLTKQKEAELQRQIRDETENDVVTRIKANNELKKILDESNKLQLENAQKAIDLAKLEVEASNGSLDSKLQLIDAEKNYQDVLETTAGFISEQKTNKTALTQEEIDLEQAVIDAKNERLINEREFQAEQQENELLKIERLKENIDFENQILLEDLERKRELYKEGTQARVDAEQEYLNAKQELDQRDIQLEEQKRQARLKTFDDLQTLAGKETKFSKALLLVKQGIALKELILEAKKTLAFSKLGLAKSTTAVAEGTAQTAKVGFPQNVPLLIGFAAQAAGILSAVKSATSTADSVASEFGGSGGGGSTPQVQAPSFNLVQGTGTDQIAESIQSQDRPIKAFVVSSDVSSQQELDRNAVETATL